MNRTPLQNKLFTMVVVMLIGITISLTIYFYSIEKIKTSGDTIFESGLQQVTTLHVLNELFNINVLDTVKELHDEKISYDDAVEILILAKEVIDKNWDKYKEREFDSKKFALIAKIEKQKSYIFNQLSDFREGYSGESFFLELTPHITALNIHLGSLIDLHLIDATTKKEKADRDFDLTIEFIIIYTVALFVITLLLLKPIIDNIKKDEKDLIIKIEEEVEKNRVKTELIMQQNKMSAMSELVNSLAHQWRQPLNVISLLVQNIELRAEMGDVNPKEINKYSEDIHTQVSFMTNTINNFVNYIKGNKVKDSFYFEEVLKKAQDILSTELVEEKVALVIDVEDFPLTTNKNGFLDMLINILKNSIEAFKRNEIEKDKKITISSKVEDGKVVLEIFDNAGGMEEQDVSRATEPYFTTEFKERGKGLGLYVVKMVVEEWLLGKLIIRNSDDGFLVSITIFNKKD